MFRVYKPKNIVRVKAVQVTTENIKELADLLMGRVPMIDMDAVEGQPPLKAGHYFEFPTLQGARQAQVGQWITRSDDNVFKVVEDAEFSGEYEIAVRTTPKA